MSYSRINTIVCSKAKFVHLVCKYNESNDYCLNFASI